MDGYEFNGTIPGTAGQPGSKTKPQPPSKSRSDEAFLAQLWKETDASLRLDEAKYGEIRRWNWKSLMAVRESERRASAGPTGS
jgi:hypothetical protein